VGEDQKRQERGKNRKRRGRGEGAIHQRSKDLWEGKVSLGYDGNGKRKRKTVCGQTKKQVQDKIRNLQNSAAAGTVGDAGQLTVAQFLTRWLENTAKAKVRKGTWTRYEQIIRLRITPSIGGVRLSKLTAIHIEQLFADLKKKDVADRGRQMAGTLLHMALAYAVHPLRLITNNPAGDVAKPRPLKPEIMVFDPDQVARFFQEASADRLYPLYVMAVDTGMREGELFGLEWSDIDFPSKSVQVKRALKEVAGEIWVEDLKTGKSRRRIDLAQATLDALHEHRKRQLAEGNAGKLVFCDSEGNYLRRPNVARRSFHPVLIRAGLPRIRFHDLRHTAATLLLLADERTKVISERLGHSNTQTTENTYHHVLPTMQKRAAEKMNLIFGQVMPRKAEA
jgi:integrase